MDSPVRDRAVFNMFIIAAQHLHIDLNRLFCHVPHPPIPHLWRKIMEACRNLAKADWLWRLRKILLDADPTSQLKHMDTTQKI